MVAENNDQLWRSGAIAAEGEGRVTTTLGEWTWCHCWVPIRSNGIQTNSLESLADITQFSTLITQKLVFANCGLCWYNYECGFEGAWLPGLELDVSAQCLCKGAQKVSQQVQSKTPTHRLLTPHVRYVRSCSQCGVQFFLTQ